MEFNKLLANINIELSDRQLEQFEIYFFLSKKACRIPLVFFTKM